MFQTLIPLQYGYFGATIVFMILWVIIFWKRKDLRKEMIIMGILIGFFSLATAYFFWTVDWWRPLTITNTRVGIEDFLLGFSNGGIAAVLYEVVFKKRLYRKYKKHDLLGPTGIVGIMAILSFLFWNIHLTSFVAISLTLMMFILFGTLIRRDLLIPSFVSGFLMILLVLPFYYGLILFYPGSIERIYQFKTLSGILITGIPVEELVFYFLFGFTMGPFYEYWQGLRIRKS